MDSKLTEKLRRIYQEIKSEMKAQRIWSVERDDSHPQISTPSDWIQWDYLPSALAAIEEGLLPEAYGNIKIDEYIGHEFEDPKFRRLRLLLKEWDQAFSEYAAPINARMPKLYERVVIHWEAPVSAVNDAFNQKFEEIRKSLKLSEYRIGEAPMDHLHEHYMTYVRDQIAGPLIFAQMKAGMLANGYSFEKFYPHEESDINLLKLNLPYPMRLEFYVPLPRTEEQIISEVQTLDLNFGLARLDELAEMAETGKMTNAIAMIQLLKNKIQSR